MLALPLVVESGVAATGGVLRPKSRQFWREMICEFGVVVLRDPMARTSTQKAPNPEGLQTVTQESSLLQAAAQLAPGMWVRVLYPPYAQGALGIVTARENADRWLVTIPGDPQGEGLLLSLSAPELLPAM
ncbi:MAG: hypothetical protein Q6L68_12410 [Thermostichus sp. DG02_5_bins_236]